MDATDKLSQTTLAQTLNATCAAFAEGFFSAHLKLSKRDIDLIPDLVFNLAVNAGWLPVPADEDEVSDLEGYVWLGEHTVEEAYRDAFLSLIQGTLDEMDPHDFDADEEAQEWEQEQEQFSDVPEERGQGAAIPAFEDPAQLLMRRKRDLGVSWGKLAMIAKNHFRTQQEADIKAGIVISRGGTFTVDTIYRMLNGRAGRMESTKALAAAVGCDWHALVWPKKAD
jgi:hypothetical protein